MFLIVRELFTEKRASGHKPAALPLQPELERHTRKVKNMMNPFKAVGRAFTQTFNFPGRASRSEYWWFTLFIFLALIVAVTYDGSVLLSSGQTEFDPNVMPYATLGTIVALFFPSLSVSIRRLHDAGFSGWWYLITLLPFGAIALLIMAMLPSEKWPNKWGPPYGAKRLPGAEIFNDKPMEDVPEIFKPGNLYGPDKNAPIQTPAEINAARKAEISEYYKTRVLNKSPA